MTLEDQMRQWADANRSPYDAPTWNQMCGSLMFRFNSWRGWQTPPYNALSTAFIAGSGSGWLNPNIAAAPVGAFHFISVPGVPSGHVVQDARGGGWRCFSTGYTLGEVLGNALGFVSVSAYLAAKGATHRGWATNYAGGVIASISETAGGGGTPIDNSEFVGGKKMRLAWAESTGYLVTEDGWHGLASPQIYQLFFRLINSNQANSPFVNGKVPENFNKAEVDIMNANLRLVRVANRIDVAIDSVKLASALRDELVKAGIPVTIENLADADFQVDPVSLAAAFDAAVPRVAKAIVKQAGEALAAAPA
jgi:hypothetical protein